MSSYFLEDLREELRNAATRRAAGARRRRRASPARAAAIALVALATVAAVLGARAITQPDTRAAAGPSPAVSSVDPEVAKEFATLRRPLTPADAIPARWVNQARGLAKADWGPSIHPDFAAARRASPEMPLWIVPGSGGVCLFEALGDGGGFECGTLALATSGHIFGISSGAGSGLPARERQLSGLLPDGASNVSVRMRDGSTQRTPVIGNAYTMRASSGPTALVWTDSNGTTHTVSLH
jgi:hypothetical protein